VTQPHLYVVNQLDCVQVDRVYGQTVKRIRRQSDDTACSQAAHNVLDLFRLRLIRLHAQYFR
jgi:hypothetical protein